MTTIITTRRTIMTNDTITAPAPLADAGDRAATLEAELAKCFDEIAYQGHIANEQRARADLAEAERDRLRGEMAALCGAHKEWINARREYDALGDNEGNFDLDDEWRLRKVEQDAAARLRTAVGWGVVAVLT